MLAETQALGFGNLQEIVDNPQPQVLKDKSID